MSRSPRTRLRNPLNLVPDASEITFPRTGDLRTNGANTPTSLDFYTDDAWRPLAWRYTSSKTVTVGTDEDYATITDALDAARGWEIDSDALLTFSLADGEHEITKALVIDHPHAGSILITAATPSANVGTAISGVSISSTGAGDHDITITTSAAHGLSVGNWVAVHALTGTGPIHEIEGFWQVSAVGSTTEFTYNCTSRNATIAAITPSAGSVRKFYAIISAAGSDLRNAGEVTPFGSDPGIFDIRSCGVRIEHVGIVSDGTDSDCIGIMCREPASAFLNTVGINGVAKIGTWCLFNGYLYGTNIYVSNCGAQGIVGQQGGVINFSTVYTTGHVSAGARGRDAAGSMYLTGLRSAGNGSSGLSAEGYARVIAQSALIQNNKLTADVLVEKGAMVDLTSSTVEASGATYALRVEEGGNCYIEGASFSGGGTADISLSDGRITWSSTAPTYSTKVISSGWWNTEFYGSNIGRTYEADGSLVEVENTTTETELFSGVITAGSLGDTGAAQLRMSGHLVNGVGNGTVSGTLSVKLNGTTIMSDVVGGIAEDADTRPWWLVAEIANCGSESSNWADVTFVLANTNTASTGYGDMAVANTLRGPLSSAGTLSVDTTAAVTVSVTWTWSTAASSINLSKMYARLSKVA